MPDNQLSKIKIIAGLGNPGEQYGHTYHNAGKLFVAHFLKRLSSAESADGLKFRKPTASKNFEYLKIGDIIFVNPLLFMNESGVAAQSALKFFSALGGSARLAEAPAKRASGGKIKPEELLVVHDDSDIDLGDYKISFGRGAGGHRGAESVIQTLNTKNFWRLRIGIRPKVSSIKYQVSRKKASEFVLKKINPADGKALDLMFEKIEEDCFVNSNLTASR